MARGVLIGESLCVGTSLEGVRLGVDKVFRVDAGNEKSGQPLRTRRPALCARVLRAGRRRAGHFGGRRPDREGTQRRTGVDRHRDDLTGKLLTFWPDQSIIRSG